MPGREHFQSQAKLLEGLGVRVFQTRAGLGGVGVIELDIVSLHDMAGSGRTVLDPRAMRLPPLAIDLALYHRFAGEFARSRVCGMRISCRP